MIEQVTAVRALSTLRHKDLLGIADLTPEEILLILDTAEAMREIGYRPIKKVPTLRGKTVVNLFFENSTRTRTSFEIAEKRLSADTLNISAATSSVAKGETLVDTALNLEAMAPDMDVGHRLRLNAVDVDAFIHRHDFRCGDVVAQQDLMNGVRCGDEAVHLVILPPRKCVRLEVKGDASGRDERLRLLGRVEGERQRCRSHRMRVVRMDNVGLQVLDDA